MRNVILTNLSALPKKETETSFFASDVGEINGRYTNEAPIKYLMSYIKSSGGNTDLVIAVRTPEAGPAFNKFTEYVTAYAGEIGSPIPELVPVDTSENELESTINRVVNLFAEDDRVFIDTTGGFRNSSYLLMAVVRLLEYAGIGLTKAVYAKYPDEKKIIDITDTYHMFDLINAVNTFSTMGNSRELEKYFSDETNTTVKETIAAMNRFSDELTLCRTSRLNSVLEKLNDKLDELSALDTDSRDIVLLKSLAGMIKKKFRYSGGRIGYPDVVRWCLDNRMIQQAVTIYVEKMPEYLYKRGYYSVDETKFQIIKEKNASTHNELYSELLYNNFMNELALGESRISDIFCDAAKALSSDGHGSKGNIYWIAKGLIECPGHNEFIKRIPKKIFKQYELDNASTELRRFFKIRNALYDHMKNTRRSKDDIEKRLEAFPEIMEIIQKKMSVLPSSIDSFIKSVDNDKKLAQAIFGTKMIYEEKRLDSLDAIMESDLNTNYGLTDRLPRQQLQAIFSDIFYAKTFIRNKLNHASEEGSVSDEVKEYFFSHGYPVTTELNVETISEFIYNAIDKLKL